MQQCFHSTNCNVSTCGTVLSANWTQVTLPHASAAAAATDECRCSLPRDSNLPKGNFNWCCNTPTPRLRINRHVDLSQQAFTAVSVVPKPSNGCVICNSSTVGTCSPAHADSSPKHNACLSVVPLQMLMHACQTAADPRLTTALFLPNCILSACSW